MSSESKSRRSYRVNLPPAAHPARSETPTGPLGSRDICHSTRSVLEEPLCVAFEAAAEYTILPDRGISAPGGIGVGFDGVIQGSRERRHAQHPAQGQTGAGRTASRLRPTKAATPSSECSAASRTSGASPPATTGSPPTSRPRSRLPASSSPQPSRIATARSEAYGPHDPSPGIDVDRRALGRAGQSERDDLRGTARRERGRRVLDGPDQLRHMQRPLSDDHAELFQRDFPRGSRASWPTVIGVAVRLRGVICCGVCDVASDRVP